MMVSSSSIADDMPCLSPTSDEHMWMSGTHNDIAEDFEYDIVAVCAGVKCDDAEVESMLWYETNKSANMKIEHQHRDAGASRNGDV
jgi:hypothetical protein